MYCTSNVCRKESSSPPGTAHGNRQQKSRMRALRCVVAASVLCSVASVDPMERLKTITGRAFDSAATGTDGASQEVRVWPRRELQAHYHVGSCLGSDVYVQRGRNTCSLSEAADSH
jgi:hypothetical protein